MSQKLALTKELLEEIAEVINKTGLTEVEFKEGDKHIKIKKQPQDQFFSAHAMPTQMMMAPQPAAHHTQAAPTGATQGPAGSAPIELKTPAVDPSNVLSSPMVGTAYLSPDPAAPAFVKEGDQVTQGQTILIIEAMKVMNPIKAHKAGRLHKVCIANARPVEYGEMLAIIE